MDIKRNITTIFKEYRQVFPAVGLLGPRQVGKTTFVKGLARCDLLLEKNDRIVATVAVKPTLYTRRE